MFITLLTHWAFHKSLRSLLLGTDGKNNYFESLEESIPGEIRTHVEVRVSVRGGVRSGSCESGMLMYVNLIIRRYKSRAR